MRDIVRRLGDGRPRDAKFAGYVRPRLACARDFALAIIKDVEPLLDEVCGVREPAVIPAAVLRDWAETGLENWRKGAGYGAARPPAEWWHPGLDDPDAGGRRPAA